MKTNFGKRTPPKNTTPLPPKKNQFQNDVRKINTGKTEPTFLIIWKFILMVVAIILILAFLNSPDFAPLSLLGMSKGPFDPFKTTRTMAVPHKNRVGHRERSFRKFAAFCYFLCVGLLVLYVVIQGMDILRKGG